MYQKLSLFLSAVLLAACGGQGTTTWTVSNVIAVSDTCEFHDPANPLAGEFDITIEDSTVTIEHKELDVSATMSDYLETDDTFILNGESENTEFSPCTVKLAEKFTLALTETTKRIDTNDTLNVTWDHTETDESATDGDCTGVWFVPLPCESQITFTLTQNP
jgi:hypothetical protein